MYAYAYNWAAYVGPMCAHILMPKNPNLSLFASVSLFHLYHMLLPCLVLCF